jgi:pyruvate-formate lyase
MRHAAAPLVVLTTPRDHLGNITAGDAVGATPDGYGHEPTADGVSPRRAPQEWPTPSEVGSKLPTVLVTGGHLLNLRLTTIPCAASRHRQAAGLMRGFIYLRAWHVQFIPLYRDLKTPSTPRDYKDLIVRVGRVQRQFVALDPVLQATYRPYGAYELV